MDKTNPKIAYQRMLPSDINEGERRSGEMDVGCWRTSFSVSITFDLSVAFTMTVQGGGGRLRDRNS